MCFDSFWIDLKLTTKSFLGVLARMPMSTYLTLAVWRRQKQDRAFSCSGGCRGVYIVSNKSTLEPAAQFNGIHHHPMTLIITEFH